MTQVFGRLNGLYITHSYAISLWLLIALAQMLLLLGGATLAFVWCNKQEKSRTSTSVSVAQALSPVLIAAGLSLQVFLDIAYDGNATIVAQVGLKVLPVMMFYVARDTTFTSIVITWVITLVSLFVCSLHDHSYQGLTELMSYLFATSVVLYDGRRQLMEIYSLISKLQETLAENERLAVEAQALELRAMIGNVAHDLKTPLTSILSGIECMTEVVTSWERQLATPTDPASAAAFAAAAVENFRVLRNCLKNMHGSNSFMTMTINRCIDYTKASKGVKLVPKLETVELKPKFDMPVDLMRTVQSVVEIVVDTPVAGICSHIITDKQWLLENLLCLLSNAVKYSHKGTVEVGMDLEGAPSEPQFLRFEVQDSGVGLSEEAMQTLFNPFKQAQRLAGGTGLGLFSLAKRVEALHGQYGVRLRPDGAQGSVFWFTIPYRPDLQSAKMAEAQSALVTLLSSSSDTTAAQEEVQCLSSDASQSLPDCNTPLLTLVVDDAPMIVKMTTMLLSRKGHIVESAVNGADALEKLLQGYERARAVPSGGDNEQRESKRTPYDVVLMDLQMPVLDGIEAIRRLRATERGWQGEQGKLEAQTTAAQAAPSTPRSPHQMVIALSANSDEETRLAALEAGADAFMAKPFTYENFQICLRTAESARQPM